MICSIKRLACILLVGFISILLFSVAHAELNISSINPVPGETVYFNGTVERCGGADSCELSADIQYFVKDLMGIYIKPISLEATEIDIGSSKTNISGSFLIPSTWPSGIYEFYVDHSYAQGSLYPDGEGIDFNVSSNGSIVNTDIWSYSFNNNNFQNGSTPFVNHYQYGNQGDVDWSTSSIYINKEVYLPDPQMVRFNINVENDIQCSVNGVQVFANGNYATDSDCTRSSYNNRRATYKVNGNDYTVFCINEMNYGDIKNYDVVNLQKGWNSITCNADIDNDVYQRCVYWPNCYNYPGKQWLDIDVGMLLPDEILWTTGSHQDWNKRNLNKEDEMSFKWGTLPITDDSPFLTEPHYFISDGARYGDINLGDFPYNGQTTYFREWFISDESITKTLFISDTKQPECYFNDEEILFFDNNDAYWLYRAPVQIQNGWNLLACKSTSVAFNQFDFKISPVNPLINISDIQMSTEGGTTSFNITLNSIAHPETDTNVVIIIERDGELLYEEIQIITSAESTINTRNTDIWEKYHEEYYDNNGGTDYRCYRNQWRMFDKSWGNYGDKSCDNPWVSEKIILDFSETGGILKDYNLTQLDWIYSPYGMSSLYFYNYETDSWDFIQDDDNNNKHILTVPVNDQYISDGGEVLAKVEGARRYYEGMFDISADVLKERISEVIDSQAQTQFSYAFPEAGLYDITITAMDMFDGDTDAFYSQVEITLDMISAVNKNIGFLPFGGSDKDTKSEGSKINIIVVATVTAAAALGAAGAGLYVSTRSGPTPLKRLSGSLSKAERAMNKLSTLFAVKKYQNKTSYWSDINVKYQKYKQKLAKQATIKQKVEQLKANWEEERIKKKKEKKRKRTQREFRKLLKTPLAKGESLKDKYHKTAAFISQNFKLLSGADFTEYNKLKKFNKDAEKGIDYSTWKSPFGGWANLEKQGRELKVQLGLKENEHLGNTLEAFRKDMEIASNVDIAALLNKGSIDLFNSWRNPPLPVSTYNPVVEETNIENDSWFGKMGRGWEYKFKGAWNWMKGATSSISNFVGNGFNVLRNDPLVPFKSIANIVNNFMKDPIGNSIFGLKAIGGFIKNTAVNYVNALVNDPVDTIAKTVITIGGALTITAGLIGAPITGGASLALTVGGITMLAGAATMATHESLEFSRAGTEEELKQIAEEDIDDLLWIGGSLFSGVQTVRIGTALRYAGTISASSDDIFIAARNAGTNFDEAASLGNSPGFITSHTDELIHSFKNMGYLDDIKRGTYYIENINNPVFINNPNLIRGHELIGEMAIKNGVVKVPRWVEISPVHRDIAADTIAARFIGKQPFIKSGLPGTDYGHNWWGIDKVTRISTEGGLTYKLTPEVIKNVQNSIEIPSWFGRSWSSYTLPTQLGAEMANNVGGNNG